MPSLRAPCVARAEGHSFRVALSRGVWHGARSDAIHRDWFFNRLPARISHNPALFLFLYFILILFHILFLFLIIFLLA